MSCCAFDASKTQTALVSAIWGLFFEASWEQVSPKSPPEIADTIPLSSSCYCVVLRARCLENSPSTSIYNVCPLFEASWEQISSKLAPSAGHALCLWSRSRSLVTPTFPVHARLRRPLSQITPTCRRSCHLSLVTPTVAGQTQKSLHPTRCVQFDVLCTSRAQRNARSD